MQPTKSRMRGYAPQVLVQPVTPAAGKVNPEKEKYQKLWGEIPAYRKVAPGEHHAMQFIKQSGIKPGDDVIDFGCGTGRGALMISLFGRANVTMLDFTDNCLDPEVKQALKTQEGKLRFVQHDLEESLHGVVAAKYGYCCDVMEHIPENKVEYVLRNIMKAAQNVFFSISTVDDCCGATIGEKLHLCVKPYGWWLDLFRRLDTVVYWSHESETDAFFYLSSWNDASEVVKRGTVNTEDKVVFEHVKSCLARGLQEVKPHVRQDVPIMLIGGGPSLAEYEEEITRKRREGQPMITLNGTYNWAVERGLKPSAQIICDARPFNARFVTPHVDTCKYLLASQCHPDVFDAAPKDERTFVWHAAMNGPIYDLIDGIKGKGAEWYPIPGGSTVMLRAFCLLRMLGLWMFEVYGFDSCLQEQWVIAHPSGELYLRDDGTPLDFDTAEAAEAATRALFGDLTAWRPKLKFMHHAYKQDENDQKTVAKIICKPDKKIFYGHPWMVSQAEEFMEETKLLGEEVKMVVKGKGLIAHILQTGAELE